MPSENTPEIKKFIRENAGLLWHMRKDEIEKIGIGTLVETILNFGDEKSVKKLFALVGIEKVAKVFFLQTSKSRVGYFPRTVHFFKLYFKRNAS